jgi:S-disulfanyl-L-cysteine oxidoreductase SoxD
MMAMKRPMLWALLGAGAALAAVAAFVLLRGDGGSRLRLDDPSLLARGQTLYATHCASCHGARLEGQPNWRQRGPDGRLPAPPHDASGHTWHHPDELLIRLTKLGVAEAAGITDYQSAMPRYAGVLSDEEIVAVLSWIKSQWPAAIRAQHDEINRQAGEKPRTSP